MPDVERALEAMRERYEGSLAQHGAGSSLAVGWNDAGLQAMRFDVLAQVMEEGAPVTVADFGCGTGARSRTSRRASARRWPATWATTSSRGSWPPRAPSTPIPARASWSPRR